jgi:metal-responsive CopG/Arc/MetJ family transcriptional regulator
MSKLKDNILAELKNKSLVDTSNKQISINLPNNIVKDIDDLVVSIKEISPNSNVLPRSRNKLIELAVIAYLEAAEEALDAFGSTQK